MINLFIFTYLWLPIVKGYKKMTNDIDLKEDPVFEIEINIFRIRNRNIFFLQKMYLYT